VGGFLLVVFGITKKCDGKFWKLKVVFEKMVFLEIWLLVGGFWVKHEKRLFLGCCLLFCFCGETFRWE